MNVIDSIKEKFNNLSEEWEKGPVEKTSIVLGFLIFAIGIFLIIVSALSISGDNILWEPIIVRGIKLMPQGKELQWYTIILSSIMVLTSGFLAFKNVE